MKWTQEKLLETIQNEENSFIEIKELPLRPESLAKELVAFGNFKGGAVIFGVSDDGNIVGIEKKGFEEWVMNTVSNLVEPAILPTYH